ncbi:hypothetical protein ACHAPK_002459 [Fusarium culmorum]
MLSIYYFHSGEELLAWRTIGIAAREALEMGLHRKRSLLDNFKDTDSRRLATRVFWMKNISISSVWSVTASCVPESGKPFHLLGLRHKAYQMTRPQHWTYKLKTGWSLSLPI